VHYHVETVQRFARTVEEHVVAALASRVKFGVQPLKQGGRVSDLEDCCYWIPKRLSVGSGFVRLQKAEAELLAFFIITANREKVEVQCFSWKSVRIGTPLVWLLDSHRSPQSNVQRSESLLAVQDRGEFSIRKRAEFRAMGRVSLMINLNKTVELKLPASVRLNLPKQKCAEWITLHEAIEQPANLLWFPNKLALNRRQHVEVSTDRVERVLDCQSGLVH
jgi:hypothetical protein